MDNRTKELIAVGASLTANCQPCLKYHVSKAREHGAAEDDIAEAIEVARMVRKGAMSKMDQFVSKTPGDHHARSNDARTGCGCG